MIYLVYFCLACHGLALLLSLIRLERGKSTPDRAVAIDVTTAASIGIVMMTLVVSNRSDLLALMIVLAATGFLTSTTVARFVSKDSEAESRILTWEEARAQEAQQHQIQDQDLPAHMVDGEVD